MQKISRLATLLVFTLCVIGFMANLWVTERHEPAFVVKLWSGNHVVGTLLKNTCYKTNKNGRLLAIRTAIVNRNVKKKQKKKTNKQTKKKTQKTRVPNN